MKSNEVTKMLNDTVSVLGFDPMEIAQGSDKWLKMKLGVISASNAGKMLNQKTQTYKTYLAELVGQVATGVMPQIGAQALSWGNDHEDAARAMYEFESGVSVVEYPFIYKTKDMRAGCSPDGLMGELGCEIKCPFTTKNHIEFLTKGSIKSEYEHQVQFSMWVTGAELWHFCSYDPRMKKNQLVIREVKRNTSYMERYDEAVPKLISDIDSYLEIVGMKFGDQWGNNV